VVSFRTLVAFFSFLIAFIAGCLVPVSYFGDKNETWTKRLIAIAFLAALIFLVDVFW